MLPPRQPKTLSGSEPNSPSPSSLPPHSSLVPNPCPPSDAASVQAPPVPPKPKIPIKDRVLLQSASWVGGIETPSTPPHFERHHSSSVDFGSSAFSQLAHKKPAPLPQETSHHDASLPFSRLFSSENGGQHKLPKPPPTSTPSPDTSPTPLTSSESRPFHGAFRKGFQKPPAPPPPTSSASHLGKDYPTYDKLTPLAAGEYPPYDRLAPVTVLPSPEKPVQFDPAPPLPPRRPSRPPKPNKVARDSSVPPIPPKGT